MVVIPEGTVVHVGGLPFRLIEATKADAQGTSYRMEIKNSQQDAASVPGPVAIMKINYTRSPARARPVNEHERAEFEEDIEITPEMIWAGASELAELSIADSLEEIVRRVYAAMQIVKVLDQEKRYINLLKF